MPSRDGTLSVSVERTKAKRGAIAPNGGQSGQDAWAYGESVYGRLRQIFTAAFDKSTRNVNAMQRKHCADSMASPVNFMQERPMPERFGGLTGVK
jgi:hypothetical protein